MDKIKPTAFIRTLTKEQQDLIERALRQEMWAEEGQRTAPDQLLNTDNNLNYTLNEEESKPEENYWIYEVSDPNGPKNLDEMREMPDVAIEVNLDMLMEPYASGLDNFRWKKVEDGMDGRLSDLEDMVDWRLLLGWNDMNKIERFVKQSDDFGNVIDWDWDGDNLVINTMSGVERYSRSDLRDVLNPGRTYMREEDAWERWNSSGQSADDMAGMTDPESERSSAILDRYLYDDGPDMLSKEEMDVLLSRNGVDKMNDSEMADAILGIVSGRKRKREDWAKFDEEVEILKADIDYSTAEDAKLIIEELNDREQYKRRVNDMITGDAPFSDTTVDQAIDIAEQALLDSGWKKTDLFVMDDDGEIIDSNHPQFTDDMDVTGYTEAGRNKFEEYYNMALDNIEFTNIESEWNGDQAIPLKGKRRRRAMAMSPNVDLLINEVLDENRRRAGKRGSVADRYAANAVQSALIKEALAQGASFREAFAASQGKFWRKGVHELRNEYGNKSTALRLQKNLMKAMRPELHPRKGSSRFRNIRTRSGTRKYNYVGTGKNTDVSKLAHLLRNRGYYARVIPNTQGHGLYLNKR
jgi:hypothetical protein